MDFSKHLADYELEYEVNIRKVFSTRPLKNKRKILRKLLIKESSEPRSQVGLNLSTTTYDNEYYDINQSEKSYRDTIGEFEGRVQDLNIPNDRLEEGTSFKNETNPSCIQYGAELDEEPQVTNINDSVLNQTSNIINPSTQTNTRCSSDKEPIKFPNKGVPQLKGIKFNGKSKNLFSFSEKNSEIAESRKVTDDELSTSAIELFTNDAYYWYGSIKHSVTDWKTVVEKLMKDFLRSDTEDQFWEQIKHRNQRKNESVTLYVAHIETVADYPVQSLNAQKLNTSGGVLPEYISQLALVDIASVGQLSSLCRKLENTSYLKSKQSSPLVFTSGPSTSSDFNRNNCNNFNKNNQVMYRNNKYSQNANTFSQNTSNNGSFKNETVRNNNSVNNSRNFVNDDTNSPEASTSNSTRTTIVKPYIEGTRFTTITDHYSLLWLSNLNNPSGKHSRSALCLRQHSFDSVYRKGCNNIIPGASGIIPPDNMEHLDQPLNKSFSVESIAFREIDVKQVDTWNYYFRNKIIKDSDKYPQWKVENDTVLQFIPSNSPSKPDLPEWKILVPKSQGREVMSSCHIPLLVNIFYSFKL
ncbi:hypothetical protein JTB14_008164 [Gonioctena quinquepunctata]|nr:hypothetical protein JTB14_008164 [Gonioctena quinquepunctata]